MPDWTNWLTEEEQKRYNTCRHHAQPHTGKGSRDDVLFREWLETTLRTVAASRALVEEKQDMLQALFDYTKELESRFSTWAVSRPSIAQFPEGAEELGNRIRAALALTEDEMRKRLEE